MKKKNVVFLLVDGLNQEYLGPKEYKPTPSPFIDQLIKQSVSFSNLYASAPYTEGAMIDLMCGYRTLSRKSFLENLKYAPVTFNEMLHDNGYEVASILWDYSDYKSFERGVDDKKVMTFPSFNCIWYGRFSFYAERYHNQELPESKFLVMEDLLKDYFESYSDILRKLINEDISVAALCKAHNDKEMLKKNLSLLGIESDAFQQNPRQYIIEILDQGVSHPIFKSQITDFWKQTDTMTQNYERLIKEYKPTIERMKLLQSKGNRKYVGGAGKNALKTAGLMVSKTADLIHRKALTHHNFLYEVGMTALELSIYGNRSINNILKSGKKIQTVKNTPCAKIEFDQFFDWYKNQYDHEKPFFYYMHIDDVHVNPIPYSYSSEVYDLLKEEFDYMKQYVDSLDRTYHGNIMYDLAIHHIDHKVEQFYNEMNRMHIFDDTIFVITADHGFYYSFNEFRQDSIENMYRENYHIPFIWYERGMDSTENSQFHMQIDEPFSILKRLDINPPESFEGKDMFSTSRPYVTMEWPGRGSPDMESKLLYLCAFDEKYKVCARFKLSQRFCKDCITEIYDETTDRYETKNLYKNQEYFKNCDYLIDLLSKRAEELQKYYRNIV